MAKGMATNDVELWMDKRKEIVSALLRVSCQGYFQC